MTTELSYKEVKKTVFKIPVQQLLIGVLLAVAFYVFKGQASALAALSGAVISTLGSLVFAVIVFVSPARDQRQIKSRMVTGELLKIFTVVILFYVSIVVLKFALLPLLLGFVATFITFWVALLTAFK